jgi:S-adenosylmethionine decarboxylase
MQSFGPHLTLDLSDCNPERLSNLQLVFDLLNDLPDKIGMTKITTPYVFPYSGLWPEDRGITGVIVIAESHISVHTFSLKRYAFVDIFSCRQFDCEFAANFVTQYFEAAKVESHIVERGHDFPRHK